MTKFEESALRNSAAEQNSSTLPYWHPSSDFSSLISPHDSQDDRLRFLTLASEQMPPPPPQQSSGEQAVDFAAFGDISQLAHDFTTAEQSSSAAQFTSGISVKFGDAKTLNEHVRSHHVRGAGSFVCQWQGCDKGAFPTANKLVRHVHSHTGYKPFQCPSCTHAFVTKDQLDKHITTHTGAKDFLCDWPGCGRSFAVKHALDGHMNSVHLKAKKHACPHCSQAFDDSSNLSKHKKQVHNPETAIRCPGRRSHGCTYVDSRKDKMKEHCERKCHGLEIASDPHKWNLWVQQFKSSSRKVDSRRSREISGTPLSRASSNMSTPFCTPVMPCNKQGCSIPVCLPCSAFCNDYELFPGPVQPCSDTTCDPCDPCNDPDCDLSTRHECDVEPCTIKHELCAFQPHPCTLRHETCALQSEPCHIPHKPCTWTNCRSASPTPSQEPPTPHSVMSQSAYYGYHALEGDGDLFQDADHPFHLNPTQLNEYVFMNQ